MHISPYDAIESVGIGAKRPTDLKSRTRAKHGISRKQLLASRKARRKPVPAPVVPNVGERAVNVGDLVVKLRAAWRK